MKKTGIIIGIILVILGISIGGSYNNLVGLNEMVEYRLSQIETNLQRRADLIPNLVATVQGYAVHEEAIMTEIAQSRSRLIGAGSAADK
ncbi:MAG: LemA family protein, partial [Syntrophomonadaceae bacterium]|nr:LemA family protein [Syntrophomonadaceae bacterium]